MGGIRQFNFVVGPETSTAPTTTTPSAAADLISLGYLEDQSDWALHVADYAALRALDATQRATGQTRLVYATEEDWYFNAASTGTDDGATILKPNDLGGGDPGRWLIKTAAGGGGGGGSSGIESLMQKLENEKYNILTEDLDNTIGVSGRQTLFDKAFNATLLKTQSASVSSVELVWNAKAISPSDQNYDSTTGWTVQGAGASLTASNTSGDFQVGSFGLKFDKNNTATTAGIRFDRGAQDLSLNANSRVWLYFYLPSTTDVTNIYLKQYADTTANFQTFTATTNYAGGAFATGWNLILMDISTGGSASGTGWDITKLSRYAEVGITTGSAATTKTGLILDSLYYSYYRPQDIGVIANEFTLFNNSVKEDIVVDNANTLHDGPLTLVSATTNAFNGGLSGTSRGRVQRTTMASVGDSQIPMDNDSSFSGAITTTQELRFAGMLREDTAGDLTTIVDAIGVQAYLVNTVGGSTIGVTDPSDQHLNLLNGDTIDIFRPVTVNGKTKYVFRTSQALTANSSFSGGTTTLTLTTTGIAVNDYAVKRHISQIATSVVGESAEESFSASSLDGSPNGVQLLNDGIPYPNPESLWAHYWLGSTSQADAIRNRLSNGVGPTLTVNGTVNTGAAFQRGRFSLEGNTTSNYLSIPAAITDLESNSVKLQFSLWFYYGGTSASTRTIIARFTNPNGFYLFNQGSSALIQLQINATTNTGLSATTGWNHVHLVVNEAGSSYFYLNGVRSDAVSATPTATATNFTIGAAIGPGTGSTGLYFADMPVWRGGSTLTAGQVQTIWNGGVFQGIGAAFRQRYRATSAGVNGFKVSTRIRISRSTTAVNPTIWKAGSLIG